MLFSAIQTHLSLNSVSCQPSCKALYCSGLAWLIHPHKPHLLLNHNLSAKFYNLQYLFPCYQLVPENGLGDAVRLHQAASSPPFPLQIISPPNPYKLSTSLYQDMIVCISSLLTGYIHYCLTLYIHTQCTEMNQVSHPLLKQYHCLGDKQRSKEKWLSTL